MTERVSKKSKTETNEDLLKELSQKYPENSYKISLHGNVIRKYGKTWLVVCSHNIRKVTCKNEICGGGTSLCIHKIPRSHCPDTNCGGGGSLCSHKILKSACRELACNGGSAFCKHNIQKTRCLEPECKGGGGYCIHRIQKSRCKAKECKGGASICSHGIIRTKCRFVECEGGSAFCPCNQRKEYCVKHGGSGLCVKCKTQAKKTDDLCTSCHPDYIPTAKNASKIGCMYICALQSYLGNGLVIQHVHYDKITKNAIGNEYKLPEYKHKKVDGYYINDEGQRIIIEFLGDVFHGHPSKWGEDEQERDLYGRLYKDNFTETERKFNKVISFGYIVKYVWECEYRHLKVFQSPQSILRVFDGKLRY